MSDTINGSGAVTSEEAQAAQVEGDASVVDTQAAPYTESEGHVPDPTATYGTLDTSGTAGGQHESIENVSPVFEAARALDLQTAARALDPEDKDVDASLVSTTSAVTVVAGDPEADKRRVLEAAAAYKDEPVALQDPSLTESQEQAEHLDEVGGDQVAAEVEAEQRGASGAGSDKVGDGDEATAPAAADESGTTDTTDAGAEQGEEFDPSAHNAEDVHAYLADASDEEKSRVLDAERAGKARKGILNA